MKEMPNFFVFSSHFLLEALEEAAKSRAELQEVSWFRDVPSFLVTEFRHLTFSSETEP